MSNYLSVSGNTVNVIEAASANDARKKAFTHYGVPYHCFMGELITSDEVTDFKLVEAVKFIAGNCPNKTTEVMCMTMGFLGDRLTYVLGTNVKCDNIEYFE